MGELNLYYPQWQGGGKQKTLYLGAAAARKGLNLKSRLQEIKLVSNDKVEAENGIMGYRTLMEQLKTVKNVIDERQPGSVFTLGGGSEVSILPISHINKLAEGNLSVLWISAHPDLKTIDACEEKLQNMALRTLLENDFEELDQMMASKLNPDQIFILGGQSATEEEKAYMEEKGINWVPMEKLIWSDPKSWMENLKENVFVCLNFDALEPEAFPHAYRRAEHGMQIEQALGLMKSLEDERSIVGFSMVEYACTEPEPIEEFKALGALGLWI